MGVKFCLPNCVFKYINYSAYTTAQAVGLLKPGGVLVYSTCTYSPEENESQVHWVLQKYNNMQLVEQVCIIVQ